MAGQHHPVARAAVLKAVNAVLHGEKRRATISVSFVGPGRIRRLNHQWLGHDRVTDVVSFGLKSPRGRVVGDVYVCRAVAVRQSRQLGISARRELLRLVIHGTLHALGYDHPESGDRTSSLMWRKQERYLRCVR